MASIEDDLDPARARALFAATDDAFFDIDVSDLTIRWSRGIALALSRDPASVGEHLVDWQCLIHPGDARLATRARRALITHGAWTGELRVRRPDATYAPLRVRAFVSCDETGRPARVLGSVSDLSSVRRLESELREANERLRREIARERLERVRAEIFMRISTTDVLFEWWLEEERVMWSPNVEDVLGYAAPDLWSPADFARRSPEVAAELGDVRQRIAAGASAWSRRFSWLLPGGERVQIEAHAYVLESDGRPERVIGSMHRVTAAPGVPPDLTHRQRLVLSYIRLGYTNKQIAHELAVTEQAAKVHVSKLMRKFGVPNRAALAVAGRSVSSL